MNVYKHIVFNPHMIDIQRVCNRMGGHSVYALHSVLRVSEYECVAVFETWDGTLNESDVFGREKLADANNVKSLKVEAIN